MAEITWDDEKPTPPSQPASSALTPEQIFTLGGAFQSIGARPPAPMSSGDILQTVTGMGIGALPGAGKLALLAKALGGGATALGSRLVTGESPGALQTGLGALAPVLGTMGAKAATPNVLSRTPPTGELNRVLQHRLNTIRVKFDQLEPALQAHVGNQPISVGGTITDLRGALTLAKSVTARNTQRGRQMRDEILAQIRGAPQLVNAYRAAGQEFAQMSDLNRLVLGGAKGRVSAQTMARMSSQGVQEPLTEPQLSQVITAQAERPGSTAEYLRIPGLPIGFRFRPGEAEQAAGVTRLLVGNLVTQPRGTRRALAGGLTGLEALVAPGARSYDQEWGLMP